MMISIYSGGSISQYNNMSHLPLPLYTTCRLHQPGYVHFPYSLKEMEVSTVFFSAHNRATPLHEQSISSSQDIITVRLRRLTEGRYFFSIMFVCLFTARSPCESHMGPSWTQPPPLPNGDLPLASPLLYWDSNPRPVQICSTGDHLSPRTPLAGGRLVFDQHQNRDTA